MTSNYAEWTQAGIAIIGLFVGPLAFGELVKFFLFRAVAHSIPNASLIRGATGMWTIEIENKRRVLRNCLVEVYPDEIGNSITSYRKARDDDGGSLSSARLIDGGCLEININRLANNRSLVYVVSMAIPGQPLVSGVRIGITNLIHSHIGNLIYSKKEKFEWNKTMHFRLMVVMLLFLGTSIILYARISEEYIYSIIHR